MRYTFNNEYIFALLVNRKRHLNNTVCAKGYMIPLISLQPPNTSDPFKVITMILDTKLDLQYFLFSNALTILLRNVIFKRRQIETKG